MDFAVVSNTDTDIAQYRYCPKGCKASAIVRISSAYGMTDEPHVFCPAFARCWRLCVAEQVAAWLVVGEAKRRQRPETNHILTAMQLQLMKKYLCSLSDLRRKSIII
jgi:hypothetical protein